MIKLFIFDMGGVLARDFDILPEAATQLGLSEESLLDYIRDDMEGLMDGSVLSVDLWKNFTRKSGVVVRGNPLIDFFHPRLDKATMALISKLKKHCPAVCGTNTMAEHYNYHKGRGDYDVFHRVYASHLMGVAKPDPEFFEHILKHESVLPEEVVFCDDLSENIKAAGDMGIHSFLYKDAETFTREFSKSKVSTL